MDKIYFYNTLSRKKEEFIPISECKAGIYTCGPTVYNFAHIGNLRAYFFEDVLKRVLLYNGYEVRHIMNITDVGHLVSDEDEGEDKMEKGSAREGKSVWEIADFYTEAFKKDISLLNILPPTIYCKATDFIDEQIEMVKCLQEKGYTYKISDGIYYDTSKFHDYGKMALLDIEGLEEGKRVEQNKEKRNKTDFALWKFSPKDEQRQMEWESPWGKGFPGWHLECSAMSIKFLGNNFDIHCGGIDHVPVHHTNEIAQAEACTGEKFVNYWLHGEFLIEEKGKMSKSKEDFLRLQKLVDKGYSPLEYRYFLLMTHYRKKIKFSFDNLDSARNGYRNLVSKIRELKADSGSGYYSGGKTEEYEDKFRKSVNDDLNVSEGLAICWEVIKDNQLASADKIYLINSFDKVLGLGLDEIEPEEPAEKIPEEIVKLAEQRILAKAEKRFSDADRIREEITGKGYKITDDKSGKYIITKIL